MARKSNWQRIQDQDVADKVQYRDVYADQQLERSRIDEKETMTGRNIINGVICLIIAVFVWFLVSVADGFALIASGPEQSENPSEVWIHMQAHYVNRTNSSDKITPEEYQELVENYDPPLPAPEKPEQPVRRDFERVTQDGVNGYRDKETGDFYTADEYKEIQDSYKEDVEIYNQLKAEYDEYYSLYADPEETYMAQKEHYRNRYSLDEVILPEEYARRVSEYEQNVSKGKIDEDILDVPVEPIAPSKLYKIKDYDTDEDGKKIALTYRNIYDGSIIDSYEYDDMVSLYNVDLEIYKTDYQAHREYFHPDNVSGKNMIISMGFTFPKLLISLTVAGIVYAILYNVFKKNLDAQNAQNETADINQYHNDQHIALPEEIQRDFDWFPDVGAKSGVQVSSMISHMALTNKGLKSVQLAKRADKDIVDSEGNVEYYKGEILRDSKGEPITSTVPIIDEKFMNELYEASGAPVAVRKSYDATKIEYNPDGKNRDKLGKFNTVADLINNDWEFPLYEPQRPGGAYIVDTAPVNTMVLAITRAGKGD